MIAGRRLWRTADGGLVEDGDPAAVALAYGPGDELAAADAEVVAGVQPTPAADDAGEKRGGRPADKARRRPAGDKRGA